MNIIDEFLTSQGHCQAILTVNYYVYEVINLSDAQITLTDVTLNEENQPSDL